jgi:hypothetical protein
VGEGNENNSISTYPGANLWLCENGPCDGPGEGNLIVFERAFNVESDYDNEDVPDASDSELRPRQHAQYAR